GAVVRVPETVGGLYPFEQDDGAAEVDLVAGFQPDAAGIAVDFAAHAVAHNPGAALGAPLVPAVAEETMLASGAVVLNVRVLAGDGAVDLGIFHEGQIVAAVQASVTIDVHLAADIGAGFLEAEFGGVGAAFP